MTTVLDVQNLEIKYHTREGTLTAIRNAGFSIQAGQIVGIVGESGCGKSTVSSAVMRLLSANGEISAGKILFDGRDLLAMTDEQMRQLCGSEISMIFQDPMTSLNPVFSIEQQMVDASLAHRVAGARPLSRQQASARAVQMLARVGIPDAEQRIKDFPHQFSGGMRQRIMIAMALQSNPSLLIADEPTSALDVTLEAQVIDLIRGLRDELQTAILYITHDLGVIAQLCDRVLVMYAGNIVEAGDVVSLFAEPKHPYTQALLNSHPAHNVRAGRLTTIPGRVPSLKELPAGCKFAPRCRLAQDVCRQVEPAALQVGPHSVLCHAYRPDWCGQTPSVDLAVAERPVQPISQPGVTENVLVQTQQLDTYFATRNGFLTGLFQGRQNAVRAVEKVDLTVRRGETLALVGESGSGKTTLGRTILRLEDATGGQVVYDGVDITRLAQRRVRPLRAGMQMIFQDPVSSLSPRKKVSALLLEPFKIHGVPVDGKEKVNELLAMVGLSSEQADKYPHQLSGGQARRVGIARALALQPELLIADEPTAGLDVSVAAGVLNLLKDLRERLYLTYIVITHNLNVISFVADRVAVMYLGRIVELADGESLFSAPRHPYSQALLSAISLPDPALRGKRQRILLPGEIPSPRNPPPGCPFHPRCHFRQERCSSQAPPLAACEQANGRSRLVACHFPLN